MIQNDSSMRRVASYNGVFLFWVFCANLLIVGCILQVRTERVVDQDHFEFAAYHTLGGMLTDVK